GGARAGQGGSAAPPWLCNTQTNFRSKSEKQRHARSGLTPLHSPGSTEFPWWLMDR
ncbi:unnamed protein product, partial [Linum tenue]